MNEKIRSHLDSLFMDAPNTKRAFDLKEELIFNLQDKYKDLIAEGKSETDAYNNVISGIGEIDELLMDLERANPMNTKAVEKNRRKSAFIVSLCVGLYILALVSMIILDEFNMPDFITASTFFILAGIPSCILIYHFMSKPKYIKIDDTLVEEFKEWKSDKSKDKEIKGAIHSAFWTLIVALYFIISFAFNSWSFSWIIFLVGAAVSEIIELCFKLKK